MSIRDAWRVWINACRCAWWRGGKREWYSLNPGVKGKGGTQGTWLSDGEVTFLLITPHLPADPLLTGLRAAAGIRAARASDVAAAAVRAALAPADPHEHEEEEDPQDHQANKHPLWKDAQRNLLEVAPLPGTAHTDGCLPAKEVSGKDLGKKGHLTSTEGPQTHEERRVRNARVQRKESQVACISWGTPCSQPCDGSP